MFAKNFARPHYTVLHKFLIIKVHYAGVIKAYISLILVTILLFAGGLFLLSSGGQSDEAIMAKVKFYQKTDPGKPVLELVGPNKQDLGSLSVKSEKSAVFNIRNSGQKTLQIYAGTSSCNCTFGQVTKANGKSPLFGMHDKRKFLVELGPGETGNVVVTYKPYLMPSLGLNKRIVSIKTNDPDNPEVEFDIEAIVTE